MYGLLTFSSIARNRPKAELTITALPHVANDRTEEDSAQHLAAVLPNGEPGVLIQSPRNRRAHAGGARVDRIA